MRFCASFDCLQVIHLFAEIDAQEIILEQFQTVSKF